MENTTKTWQQELAEMLEAVPEAQKQRVHDFLMGALAAGQMTHGGDRARQKKPFPHEREEDRGGAGV